MSAVSAQADSAPGRPAAGAAAARLRKAARRPASAAPAQATDPPPLIRSYWAGAGADGAGRWRAARCHSTKALAAITGGTIVRLRAIHPAVAWIAPEANAVHATVPNTRKSLVACTFTRSCGS